MRQNLQKYFKIALFVITGACLFLAGVLTQYFISENRCKLNQNIEEEPDRQQIYAELKEQYPVFNLATNGDYTTPPELYLKMACNKDYAVVAEVTEGCEETIKSEVVKRMWLSPIETEEDYTREDITEILRQDPRRLYWGKNCNDMQIRIEQDIYGNWTGPEELEVGLRPKRVTNDLPWLKAYTGMRLVLFLNEYLENGEVVYKVDLYHPFFITEENRIVPACTLLIGYEEYGGMQLEEFVEKVRETWEVAQSETTEEE